MSRRKIIVSACLAGIPCRYDGKAQPNDTVTELVKAGAALPVCAECLGGLDTPRISCEIDGGSGEDVLAGRAKVIRKGGSGEDASLPFIKGAYCVLQAARSVNAEIAILKSNSPSCGCGKIYDGSFTGSKREGDGVTAALLKANGIKVFSL